MTTRLDDDPEFASDDPLAVILRPPSDHIGPPPGRYEAIRRAAARRRLLRAAAGVGLSCAVAVLIALSVQLSAPDTPASPTVPLAPPPASRDVAPPGPPKPPEPISPRPSQGPTTGAPGSKAPNDSVVPRGATPAPKVPGVPRADPSDAAGTKN